MRSIFLEKPDPLELRLRLAGWRQIGVWLPPVLAMAIIATESTNTFSAANTSGWLRPFFERFLGHINDGAWDTAHHIFRKSGHFIGYGTVCLTFLRAWLLTLGTVAELARTAWRQRSCVLAILCTAAVASLDEWHQTFIPSRTGLLSDALLDTVGGAVSCALVWVFFWRKQRRRRRLR